LIMNVPPSQSKYSPSNSKPSDHLQVDLDRPSEDQSTTTQEPSINSQENMLFPPHLLSNIERWGVRLVHKMIASSWGVRLGMGWTRIFATPLVSLLSKPRWRVHGIERLESLSEDAPLLLIANHRTFFDLFVIVSALRTHTSNRVGTRCVFPVRAPFFYDHPLGLLLNLVASGGSMYPPIFRDKRKQELNPQGLKVMEWLIKQPGLLFGFHPEGRRTQNQDLFVLSPFRKGVGTLLQNPHPDLRIIPVFAHGLTNDLVDEVKHRFKGKKARPIHLFFGDPIAGSTCTGSPEEIADFLHTRLSLVMDQARLASLESPSA
jgi:1-acyl-sn-glycerol-3-phosphate acyltransferase